MVVVVTTDTLCHGRAACRTALALRLQIVLQLREGTLRRTQISRLESLTQCIEIAADRVAGRRGRSTVLYLLRQQLPQCRVSLLCIRQVSGLERFGELFEILSDLLAAALVLRLSRNGKERNR